MKKMLKNNLFFKLASLIFAIIIWYAIINLSDPIDTRIIKNIPIKTINEDALVSRDKAYSLGNNARVSIEVSGRITVISNLTENDFIAEADLSKLSITNTVEVVIKPKVEDLDISITNSTRLVNVNIENVIEAPFPVSIVALGKPDENFTIGEIITEPKEVIVKGAESVIKNIKEIRGEINVDGIKEDIEQEVDIVPLDVDGKPFNDDILTLNEVKVKAKVNLYKIKSVPIVVNGIPKPSKGYSISDVVVNPSTINITANDSLLSSITEINIAYDEKKFGLLQNDTISVTLDLNDYIPEKVKLTGMADKVTIKIELSETMTKELVIPKEIIQIKSKINGLSYEIEDSNITVKAYGSKAVFDKLEKVEKLQPYVVFNGLNTGTYDVELKFGNNKYLEFDKTNIKVKIKTN